MAQSNNQNPSVSDSYVYPTVAHVFRASALSKTLKLIPDEHVREAKLAWVQELSKCGYTISRLVRDLRMANGADLPVLPTPDHWSSGLEKQLRKVHRVWHWSRAIAPIMWAFESFYNAQVNWCTAIRDAHIAHRLCVMIGILVSYDVYERFCQATEESRRAKRLDRARQLLLAEYEQRAREAADTIYVRQLVNDVFTRVRQNAEVVRSRCALNALWRANRAARHRHALASHGYAAKHGTVPIRGRPGPGRFTAAEFARWRFRVICGLGIKPQSGIKVAAASSAPKLTRAERASEHNKRREERDAQQRAAAKAREVAQYKQRPKLERKREVLAARDKRSGVIPQSGINAGVRTARPLYSRRVRALAFQGHLWPWHQAAKRDQGGGSIVST